MPRLSDKTRADRRQHILTSAWKCFSRNGFHATSIDDVIAETGMSSSAVYRYFRSKDEIIEATSEEGLARVRGMFVAILDLDPCPSPAETVALLAGELDRKATHPDYDMTRIALQGWAEALRNPRLLERARTIYADTLGHVDELARRWRTDGHLPADADTRAAAVTLFSLMPGLIVMHHLVEDVPAETLHTGLSLLGAGLARG
ncbi:TetR/AcrR family transcriptional regulator [Lentzea tibetensis]|uniref:TetR/AcrR family transcriptional regulator n=1 Tax=Lentzea tibetensis TaxID=2591470 RepID=A0A563EZE5_9PSEU|nr:TetR/AcrR family transcriptional regulator [Lentzea tibetensis]TWP52494.1 TetR/AcrR family transcriptional regulator [Lentzea tibetensis]